MKQRTDRRTSQINIRLTQRLRRELHAAAIFRVLSLSSFMIQAAIKELCRAKRDGLVFRQRGAE